MSINLTAQKSVLGCFRFVGMLGQRIEIVNLGGARLAAALAFTAAAVVEPIPATLPRKIAILIAI
eukprot:1568986-Prymnesium_polylepis.1